MAASFIELSLDLTARGSKLISFDSHESEVGTAENDAQLAGDAAGGFVYKIQTKITRNRYITWKVRDNIIELQEFSLDYDLFGNILEIAVPGEILISNVILGESEEQLYIFFATRNTVHQIFLDHPNHGKYGFVLPTGMNISLPSVFHDADNRYTHQQVALTQPCSNFDVTVTTEHNVYFGLVTLNKSLLIVELHDKPDECLCVELKEASVMQRLWTGLVPSFVRGDNSGLDVEDVILHSFGNEAFAFTLCRDLKIRVWSIQSQTCVFIKDLVTLIPDKLDPSTDVVGPLSLRKAKGSSSGQLILAAHCCLQYSSQFLILEVFKDLKDVTIMHVSNFFSDFNNVQDICLTTQYVWALWSNADGQHSVSYAPIEGGKDFERGWHSVHVKQDEKSDLFIPMFRDAKEVYVEYLFTPGNFDQQSIIKALQVFATTTGQGMELVPDEHCSISVVKESVIQVLDLEIDENTVNRDLSPEARQEIEHQCWSKFFSFFQQCKQGKEQPLGIFVEENNRFPLLLRQGCCSCLYYLDWVDHLYQTDLDTCEGVQSFIDNELDLEGNSISDDILTVFECLKTIPEEFSAEVIHGIDHDLDGNEDVKTFLSSMATTLITNTSDFGQLVGDSVERGDYLTQTEGRLKHIQNPQKAVDMILSALESCTFETTSMLDQSDVSPSHQTRQFLCSNEGVQLVTQILKVTSFVRMHLCRDLYVLLQLMEKISCKIGMDLSTAKNFGSLTSASCYELLRSYHTIYWSTQETFEEIDPSTFDVNLTNLASLRITDRSPSSKTARKTDKQQDENQPTSLLYCFVRDVGVLNSLKYLTETNLNAMKPGDYSLAEMVKLISQACLNGVWVLNDRCSDFPEYLASHCQYRNLNDYLHLCDDWCSVSRGTKDFLLGQSYLGTDEPEKAMRYFISAARGISLQEPLLINLLQGNEGNKQAALVNYFIKVMRLMEQFDHAQFVISAASTAITISTKDDINVPMLWSVVFKYHLELEHHNEAYAAIIHNTDKVRRHDCLRHFIITLCERGLFQEICSYPYINLEEEVVSIIEARARTMDITINKYYDLLYSYHIIKNDYRKASTVMYEQACRLCSEMHGLKSLQKQAKCYLACLTTLKLVDSKYTWIVRPQEKLAHATNTTTVDQTYSHSPKRKENGEEVYYAKTLKEKSHKTIIVELDDLEKEYLLVLARLKLVQYGKNETLSVGSSLTPSETVALLAQTGLFDMSFSVAEKFQLSRKNIFEILAGKCATLVRNRTSEFDEKWKWLSLNDINTTQLVSAKTAAQQAFLLLQSYLNKYQVNNSSVHMKAVAAKFLNVGCSLPSWLIRDYEFLNPAELLHLYLCFDLVHEATKLSVKYIDAVLGKGKEYLGLNTALHATTPAVWLPYTSFDQLLAALRSNFDNPETAQLCEELQDKLNDYFNQLEITSCDKMDYLQKRSARMA